MKAEKKRFLDWEIFSSDRAILILNNVRARSVRRGWHTTSNREKKKTEWGTNKKRNPTIRGITCSLALFPLVMSMCLKYFFFFSNGGASARRKVQKFLLFVSEKAESGEGSIWAFVALCGAWKLGFAKPLSVRIGADFFSLLLQVSHHHLSVTHFSRYRDALSPLGARRHTANRRTVTKQHRDWLQRYINRPSNGLPIPPHWLCFSPLSLLLAPSRKKKSSDCVTRRGSKSHYHRADTVGGAGVLAHFARHRNSLFGLLLVFASILIIFFRVQSFKYLICFSFFSCTNTWLEVSFLFLFFSPYIRDGWLRMAKQKCFFSFSFRSNSRARERERGGLGAFSLASRARACVCVCEWQSRSLFLVSIRWGPGSSRAGNTTISHDLKSKMASPFEWRIFLNFSPIETLISTDKNALKSTTDG